MSAKKASPQTLAFGMAACSLVTFLITNSLTACIILICLSLMILAYNAKSNYSRALTILLQFLFNTLLIISSAKTSYAVFINNQRAVIVIAGFMVCIIMCFLQTNSFNQIIGTDTVKNNTYMRIFTSTHKLIKGIISAKYSWLYVVNIAKYLNSLIKTYFNFHTNTGKLQENDTNVQAKTGDKRSKQKLWQLFKYLISIAGILATTYTVYASTKTIMTLTHFQHVQTCLISIVTLTALCEITNALFRILHENKNYKNKKIYKGIRYFGALISLLAIVPKIFLLIESLKLVNTTLGLSPTLLQTLTIIFIIINTTSIILSVLVNYFPEPKLSENRYKKFKFKFKILFGFFSLAIAFNAICIFATEFIQTYSLNAGASEALTIFIITIAALYSLSVITNWLVNLSWLNIKFENTYLSKSTLRKNQDAVTMQNTQSRTDTLPSQNKP